MESAAPTVLWRMFRSGGRAPGAAPAPGWEHVRALILPGGPPYTLAFFANDQLDRAENYDTMELAVFRSDEIQRSLAADGWGDEH